MFSIDDLDYTDLISENTKERISNLDETQQADFVTALGERIVTKYHNLPKEEQLNLNTIDQIILKATEEVLDEIEGKPVDNWKNGLDLL